MKIIYMNNDSRKFGYTNDINSITGEKLRRDVHCMISDSSALRIRIHMQIHIDDLRQVQTTS